MRLSYTTVKCGHFSFTICSGSKVSKVGTSQLINPLPVHNMWSRCHDKSQFTHVKQLLAILCPKILKIMPVDAYNASIILKCLHALIMLKIMPA